MENTTRLVDAGFRLSLTTARSATSEWESVLTTAGSLEAYSEKYDSVNTASVVDFMIADKENPGSVASSIRATRENARMTRTALTREVWEAINETWIMLSDTFNSELQQADLPDLLAQIRQQSALVRGTINATMLRNEIFRFVTLGTMIERADNTARTLDTKYYVLLPSSASVGSSLDRVQWEMILRCVSASRSFHWLYGGDITPAAIVDFLLQDARLPRSIAYCYEEIISALAAIETEYNARTAAHDLAASIEKHVTNSTSTAIIGSGLHEFLTEFISLNAKLSAQIETDYRFKA